MFLINEKIQHEKIYSYTKIGTDKGCALDKPQKEGFFESSELEFSL